VRRIDPDVFAGSLVTLLCVVVGLPVLFIQLGGGDPTVGPRWLWWVAFGLFVGTMVASTWLTEWLPERVGRGLFGLQVAAGMAVVLLAPGVGWIPILLVFTAALSCYVVPLRVTVGLVVANAAVIGLATWLFAGRAFDAVLALLLYVLLQAVSVAAVVGQQRIEHSGRELAEAHTRLRATSTLLEDQSRATERLRIARDLHDVVGHQLTALTLELEVAGHLAEPPAANHVTRARAIARSLLTAVRDAVDELRDESPDLHASLAEVVADLPRPEVHLMVEDDLAVDQARATTIVRCVQELVTNAIRHTEARHLWIEVTADDDRLVLAAHDDGVGRREVTLGNGLRGIRERAEALGGTAEFRGGSGFPVEVRVPAP